MKNILDVLTEVALPKAGTFVFVFLCLHACSQSPAPNAAEQSADSILRDTSGASLGDSPGKDFRLFKFVRKDGEQPQMELKILRLSDLKEALVGTLPAEDDLKTPGQYPRFYWSADSRYLVTENSIPDTVYKREVVLFDLKNFNVAKRKKGNLLNVDPVNDIVFLYRPTAERQVICFFDLKTPDQERQREIIAAPAGRLPILTLSTKDKKVKVKAYMEGDIPINLAFPY